MDVKFFECQICDNVVIKLVDSGMPLSCCGHKMVEISPGAVDGNPDHHLPVCKAEGQKVKVDVGKELHPMKPEHYIKWIALHTNKGIHVRHLSISDEPKACFELANDEEIIGVYSFCNIHKLWKSECEKQMKSEGETHMASENENHMEYKDEKFKKSNCGTSGCGSK